MRFSLPLCWPSKKPSEYFPKKVYILRFFILSFSYIAALPRKEFPFLLRKPLNGRGQSRFALCGGESRGWCTSGISALRCFDRNAFYMTFQNFVGPFWRFFPPAHASPRRQESQFSGWGVVCWDSLLSCQVNQFVLRVYFFISATSVCLDIAIFSNFVRWNLG